jgi:pimeloyl-ACP methyl ester carboxylesterase
MLYSTSGLVPNWLIERLVGRRLWSGPAAARTIEPEPDSGVLIQDDNSSVRSVSLKGQSGSVYAASSISLLPPTSNQARTASDVVDWQISHHAGFIPSFVSSIRYAPTHEQQDRWKILGQHMRDRYERPEKEKSGVKEVYLVLGETDPIIIADELIEDAKNVLGRRFVKSKVIEGAGHDVAMARPDEVARVVLKMLGHKSK